MLSQRAFVSTLVYMDGPKGVGRYASDNHMLMSGTYAYYAFNGSYL